MNSIRKLSNAIGLTAGEIVLHKSIGDLLTISLIAETVQPWHTVGMNVHYYVGLMEYETIIPYMPTVTANKDVLSTSVYVAGETPIGAEPVTNIAIADLTFKCLAAGIGYITLTRVKPILRTEAGPVVLPEVHEDAEFVIDADVPPDPPVYGVVKIKVVIS